MSKNINLNSSNMNISGSRINWTDFIKTENTWRDKFPSFVATDEPKPTEES